MKPSRWPGTCITSTDSCLSSRLWYVRIAFMGHWEERRKGERGEGIEKEETGVAVGKVKEEEEGKKMEVKGGK